MLQTKNLRELMGPTPPHNKGFLVFQRAGRKEVLEVDEFLTIGRGLQAHLILEDDFVSQRHARIERKPGGFFLRDLQSRNGTYINGAQVFEALLQNGDTVQLGKSELLFQFERGDEKEKLVKVSKNIAWNFQLERLPAIAESRLPVLILGESGTGKELIAQQLHKLSERNRGPLVCVNCSALGESLIESELFGHTKGSFTGATHDRKGAFETARGGTLFLDEIGELPLHLQPKLLRALENQEIRPVGSDKTVRTDVRIVTATHQDLKRKVQAGQFRADLYFRLHVAQVCTPALRDRLEDFETLLYFFSKTERVRFSFDAIEKLKQHKWPGNIRELKNSVSRARALFKNQQINAEHVAQLIDELPISSLSQLLLSPPQSIREMERKLIVECLIRNRGNQRKSAQELGIPKSTLHDRLKTYEIDLDEFKR
jgi:transcriptional regulator with GAF, ATPase, and Fis domain